jgi:NADH-quinone oxidoreductase subunit C
VRKTAGTDDGRANRGPGLAAAAGRDGQGFEDLVVLGLGKLPGAVIEASVQRPHRLMAKLRPEAVLDVCRFLKSSGFDHLSSVTCVDYDAEIEMVYHLWSFKEKCLIELRSRLSGTEPKILSLASLWTGAEFHEREAYDMFGVLFEGCPNLTRVLLPDDWTVFPLRKSFKVESIHEKKKRLDAEKAKAAKMQAAAAAPPPPVAEKMAGEKVDNASPPNVVPKKGGDKI